jgi:hypothetical protein
MLTALLDTEHSASGGHRRILGVLLKLEGARSTLHLIQLVVGVYLLAILRDYSLWLCTRV